jgi:hypothetical protein
MGLPIEQFEIILTYPRNISKGLRGLDFGILGFSFGEFEGSPKQVKRPHSKPLKGYPSEKRMQLACSFGQP